MAVVPRCPTQYRVHVPIFSLFLSTAVTSVIETPGNRTAHEKSRSQGEAMPRNLHIEVEAVRRASSATKGFGFPEVADTPITQFLSVSSVKISGQIFLICAFLHGLVNYSQANCSPGFSLRMPSPSVYGFLRRPLGRPRTLYQQQLQKGSSMKRFLLAFLLVPIVFITFAVTLAAGMSGAQPVAKKSAKKASTKASKKAGSGKVAIKCPAAITAPGSSIADCPNTGCGPSLDPNLNKQKNISQNSGAPVDRDMAFLADLPDPVPGFNIGDTRTKLKALGEGTTIRVVAYALVARKGSRESCNCGLTKAADTDNHIVLVDPETAEPALKENEPDSQTAEFTPRVRLTQTKLVGADLERLITATPDKALLVRVTGVQMFDSEHSLGPFHLKRHNNWEIHPVLKLEYCPENKTCVEDSDANWVDMEE